MNVEKLLAAARLDFPTLSRLSGLSEGYIRQLSSGNRNAGPKSRTRLAKALRAHSDKLGDLADKIEHWAD